ncbi:hypothetical protein H2136_06285 [Aeromonas hydrophila]|uniref:Uncharacterized protein n=1 Tax=Aeromonas hydrophila TaxID=644 RepID=A0A926FL71_AERHY|nr:hypothetical protein [Aeromonas hydrophila]
MTSSLAGSLTGKVSQAGEHDEQAMDKALQLDEQGLARGGENLIVNGDFERGVHGWQHAGAGIEADFSAATYGLAADGHGARVSELSTDRNTQISQDLAGLKAGETVNLTFDFARRANISLQHGIEVLWNGERVFASEGDASSWQSKALTLTAREGRNTLAFRGTGESNGLGYLLDNVEATASGKAEIGQVSAQLAQDDNAARREAIRRVPMPTNSGWSRRRTAAGRHRREPVPAGGYRPAEAGGEWPAAACRHRGGSPRHDGAARYAGAPLRAGQSVRRGERAVRPALAHRLCRSSAEHGPGRSGRCRQHGRHGDRRGQIQP